MTRPTTCQCGTCIHVDAPDQIGRRHCNVCGCFTADPSDVPVHGWCRRGGLRAWEARMDDIAALGRSDSHRLDPTSRRTP